MTYQPIENYGLIGNMRTCALVGMDGSIDWFCFPKFDSPSIFAAILDDDKGGRFRIAPRQDGITYKQFYWPDTNVLVTRFLCDDGLGEIIDYMPLPIKDEMENALVRYVKVVHGELTFELYCMPAFNFARDEHTIRYDEHGICFDSDGLTLCLSTGVPLQDKNGAAHATFALKEGEAAIFYIQAGTRDMPAQPSPSIEECENLFRATVDYWRQWVRQSNYDGRWREMVQRSALALKLMTYEPTGAIVAAPTCSLPENIGGVRNWDYRYTWLRDAAFTIYGFIRIGFTQEAHDFMHWLQDRIQELNPDEPLKVMYRIDGSDDLEEETLEHLEGYKASSPVRIGNAAEKQLQLDVYGELLDSVYLYNKYGEQVSYHFWTQIRRLANWVCDNWQHKDRGIWEIRGEPQHFTYSRLMLWVALDRALRLADKRSFPADRSRWLRTRDAIYEEIMDEGWNEGIGAFVQYYGSDSLDASILLMPLVFFVSPTDPRMIKTLEAINRQPDEGGLVLDGLVYRYEYEAEVDGISEVEGTFNMCTFWLVEALTRAGKLDEARLVFERILGYANHVGLFAEETGPRGEALGNFPQAFTHLALISAAFNLDRALEGEL